jgi:gliding motility-associated-like protein
MKRILIISFLCLAQLYAGAQAIDVPKLIRVTFDTTTQNINLYWTPSATAGVVYYQVYKWIWHGSMSGVEVDRVYVPGAMQLSYYVPEVLTGPVGFFVTANFDANHLSNFSNIDSTVYLSSTFDSCTATIHLNWNDYNTWRGNIFSYKLYESINGTPYHLNKTMAEGTNQTTVTVSAYNNYRYFVLTTKNNNIDSSYSNTVKLNTRMAAIPATIDADFGTVVNNQPLVNFSVDPASELTNYILLRSNSPSGTFDSIATINTNSKSIDYTDPVDASLQPYYYRLKVLNYCNQVARISENTAATILLKLNNSGTSMSLNWTAYVNWLGGVASYRVERASNGGGYEEISSVNNLTFEDNSMAGQVGNNISSEVCYRILAKEESGKQMSSMSNEVCSSLPVNVRFEFNAFVPGSADNKTFGPKLDFIPASFSFKIYNRWGSKVFESTDPLNPDWDGYYSGSKVPEGVYRYELEYKNENGKNEIQHGDVTVVYP